MFYQTNLAQLLLEKLLLFTFKSVTLFSLPFFSHFYSKLGFLFKSNQRISTVLSLNCLSVLEICQRLITFFALQTLLGTLQTRGESLNADMLKRISYSQPTDQGIIIKDRLSRSNKNDSITQRSRSFVATTSRYY